MMEQKAHSTGVSIEDLLQLDEDQRWEVVDGQLVEVDMSAAGFLHVIVIDNLYDRLKPHVKAHNLGRVQTDGLSCNLYVDERGVQHSRIPDLSFIRHDQIPADIDWAKPFPGAPILAVEVVSPSETALSIQRKVEDYLRFGTEQVWVIYPQTEVLHIYHSQTPEVVQVYRADQTLQDDDLLPGWELRVGELFAVD